MIQSMPSSKSRFALPGLMMLAFAQGGSARSETQLGKPIRTEDAVLCVCVLCVLVCLCVYICDEEREKEKFSNVYKEKALLGDAQFPLPFFFNNSVQNSE